MAEALQYEKVNNNKIIIIIITIIIMKNCNRHSTHGHHGSKRRAANWRNTQLRVDRTHSLTSHTYINTVTTTSYEAPAELNYRIRKDFFIFKVAYLKGCFLQLSRDIAMI